MAEIDLVILDLMDTYRDGHGDDSVLGPMGDRYEELGFPDSAAQARYGNVVSALFLSNMISSYFTIRDHPRWWALGLGYGWREP